MRIQIPHTEHTAPAAPSPPARPSTGTAPAARRSGLRRTAVILNDFAVTLLRRDGDAGEALRVFRQVAETIDRAAAAAAAAAAAEAETSAEGRVEVSVSAAGGIVSGARKSRRVRSRGHKEGLERPSKKRRKSAADARKESEAGPKATHTRDVAGRGAQCPPKEKEESLWRERICRRFGLVGMYREEPDDDGGCVRFDAPRGMAADDDGSRFSLHRDAAIAAHNQALAHVTLGSYADALAMHESCAAHLSDIPHACRTHEDNVLLIECHNNAGWICLKMGRPDRAVSAFLAALKVAEDDHPINERDDPVCHEAKEGVDDGTSDDDDNDSAALGQRIVNAYVMSRRCARDVTPRPSDAVLLRKADVVSNVGQLYFRLGCFTEALAVCRTVEAVREAVLGRDHPRMAVCRYNFGLIMHRLGNHETARTNYESFLQAVEAWDVNSGPSSLAEDPHPITARSLRVAIAAARHQTGLVLSTTGRPQEAVSILLKVLQDRRDMHGPRHPDVAKTLFSVGQVLYEMGRIADARQYLEETLAMSHALFGPNHMMFVFTLSYLGQIQSHSGDTLRTLELFERAMTIAQKVFGEQHYVVINLLNVVGNLRVLRGELTAAQRCFAQASGIYVRSIMQEGDRSRGGAGGVVVTKCHRVVSPAA